MQQMRQKIIQGKARDAYACKALFLYLKTVNFNESS